MFWNEITFDQDCGASGGPKGGFRMKNTCWQLSARMKERLAEALRQKKAARQESAKKAAETRRRKKSEAAEAQLNADIVETIGTDDAETVEAFRAEMQEQHARLVDSAESYNDAFDELTRQFRGTDSAGRHNLGAFVSQLRRAEDPTKVAGFDQIVQYARDNPAILGILSGGLQGESVAVDDVEAVVFEALKQGKRQAPSINDDEVWEAMGDILAAFDGGSIETDARGIGAVFSERASYAE